MSHPSVGPAVDGRVGVTPHLQLNAELHRAGVRFVYWKPRAGAEVALAGGRKDLDLLVAERDLEAARSTLRGLEYKSFGLSFTAIPASEAWVAWSRGEDRFYYCHLHWAIHSGRLAVHEQSLDWSDALIDSARPGPHGMPVLGPEAALTLLATRAVFEPKLHDDHSGRPTRATADALASTRAECVRDELSTFVRRVFRSAHPSLVAQLLHSELANDVNVWASFRADVRRLLEPSRVAVSKQFLQRAMGTARSYVASRRRRALASAGKGAVGTTDGLRREGGLVVALIGPDGAGKSTLTTALLSWLGELFAVQALYLGRGEWVSVAQQLAANAKWTLLELVTPRRRPTSQGKSDEDGRRRPGAAAKEQRLRWLRDASAVALAERKLRSLRRARPLLRDGWILISDRFPHRTERLCDGPAIVLSEGDPLARRVLSRSERAFYRAMQRVRPDLVVRLTLPVVESIRRKPDHRADDIRAKLAATRRAEYDAVRTLDVDAAAPLADVLGEVKAAVWEAL